MKNRLTCIIPFYNEGVRLLDLLHLITKINLIDQLICIDDGSDSGMLAEEIQKKFPKVKLYILDNNSGKSAAVKYGLSISTGEFILLLDADITGIKEMELVNAIEVFKKKSLDMIILKRLNASFLVRFIRADVLLSGERLVKKSDLELVFEENVIGYQLEMAINKHMKMNNKKVIWMSNTAKNHYKYLKNSFFKGLWKDIKMYLNILSYIGLNNFLNHVFTFCKSNEKNYFSK